MESSTFFPFASSAHSAIYTRFILLMCHIITFSFLLYSASDAQLLHYGAIFGDGEEEGRGMLQSYSTKLNWWSMQFPHISCQTEAELSGPGSVGPDDRWRFYRAWQCSFHTEMRYRFSENEWQLTSVTGSRVGRARTCLSRTVISTRHISCGLRYGDTGWSIMGHESSEGLVR